MVACLLINIKDWQQNQLIVQFLRKRAQIVELLIPLEQPNYLCLHVKTYDKTPIWQVALNLESKNIKTGYGFGENFDQAKAGAVSTLVKRMKGKDCQLMSEVN